jgi:hypothetical protein
MHRFRHTVFPEQPVAEPIFGSTNEHHLRPWDKSWRILASSEAIPQMGPVLQRTLIRRISQNNLQGLLPVAIQAGEKWVLNTGRRGVHFCAVHGQSLYKGNLMIYLGNYGG